tara:strand:- start:968 stop:1261 length:294 start_codon:yes stop_codon:yes gene_type:complete
MKRKYKIVVKQYQMFELETDRPITEDDFWSDMYDIGNCELDSHIVEWKETIKPSTKVVKSTHPADKQSESLQTLIDILWDYVSESDIPEITKRMEEE